MRGLFALIAALALFIPSSTLAQDPAAARFQRSPIQGSVEAKVLPIGMDDSARVTVMLELSGDPVAVAQSKAPGRKLSRQQKDAIKANLKARQDAITRSTATGTVHTPRAPRLASA